jgi:hypothetical protein
VENLPAELIAVTCMTSAMQMMPFVQEDWQQFPSVAKLIGTNCAPMLLLWSQPYLQSTKLKTNMQCFCGFAHQKKHHVQ